MKHFSITLTILIVITQSALCQTLKKKNSKTSSPQIINIRADTSIKLEANQHPYISRIAELPDEYEAEEFYDEEDSQEATGGGYISPEEIISELSIDSSWLKMADYYSIWDSRKVNPYGIDGKSFKDTLSLVLFDSTSRWSAPIHKAAITSSFGMRGYRWHYGTDLKLNIGDSVYATFDGIVRIAKFDRRGYGNYVLVRHNNGLETLYGHLSKTNVVVGQVLKAGDIIGLGGNTGRSTGPHLHFEVRYQGNAIDPLNLYKFESDTLVCSEFRLMPTHFSYLTAVRKVKHTHYRYHKVRRGETLSTISRKVGVPMARLCKINRISKRSTLKAGRRLKVY